MAKGPIFVERQTYRQRRMMDAVRLLPLLGIALCMVPLLWPVPQVTAEPAVDPMPMSMALRYLFGIWAFLVVTGLLLWWRTTHQEHRAETFPAAPTADTPTPASSTPAPRMDEPG